MSKRRKKERKEPKPSTKSGSRKGRAKKKPGANETKAKEKKGKRPGDGDEKGPDDGPAGGPRRPPGCFYSGCVLQEISITSLARQGGRKHFFYKLMVTDVAPIRPTGEVDDAASVSIDHNNPQPAAPAVRQLVQQAEQALGRTLESLLDVDPRRGSGLTTHAFGCADECRCVKKTYRLPDGRVVDAPAHVVSDPLPPGRNAVPTTKQPAASIEERVQIPGRGTFLLTYKIRFYGTVKRFRGECKP